MEPKTASFHPSIWLRLFLHDEVDTRQAVSYVDSLKLVTVSPLAAQATTDPQPTKSTHKYGWQCALEKRAGMDEFLAVVVPPDARQPLGYPGGHRAPGYFEAVPGQTPYEALYKAADVAASRNGGGRGINHEARERFFKLAVWGRQLQTLQNELPAVSAAFDSQGIPVPASPKDWDVVPANVVPELPKAWTEPGRIAIVNEQGDRTVYLTVGFGNNSTVTRCVVLILKGTVVAEAVDFEPWDKVLYAARFKAYREYLAAVRVFRLDEALNPDMLDSSDEADDSDEVDESSDE